MPRAEVVVLRSDAGTTCEVRRAADGSLAAEGQTFAVLRAGRDQFVVGGQAMWAVRRGNERWVFVEGQAYRFVAGEGTRVRTAGEDAASLSAPMPATVTHIHVAPGDRVAAGAVVVILEAMKMELPIRASRDGTVTAVCCQRGELVQPGAPLIEIGDAAS